ncbi:WD40 domain protein [Cordyceps militaris CM01]|uniref:WD40 domain protein n=1 Tax=Cordyceps militaris (strain CM01) TaxID=983644 RepID=G3JB25_CORMM|nr:WD40 domain protein [Cordyceps militaris CM01]EGX94385.1 WD40 domain protein [Cordyceps militaris CM01]
MYASPVFPSTPLCKASLDGRLVATLSAQTITVRSVVTLQVEHIVSLPSGLGPVTSLQWSPASTRLLVCAGESVHVFSATAVDGEFSAAIHSPLLPGEKATLARFGARDGEVLVCSPSGLKLAVFDLATATAVEIAHPKFHQPASVHRSYSMRPATAHLAVLTRRGGKDFVSIHHPVSRQVQKSWAVESVVDAQAVCWTPDGRWLMLWEAAAHGHQLVLYTADGQHFRTITGANLSDDPDAFLELGIRTCQPSPSSELCAIGDHSRGVVILQTDSWRKSAIFTHPVTIEPRDALHVWQEQLTISREGETVHTFQRATQPISPPGTPSDGKPTDTKSGCASLAFDASSTLLATRLDDAPGTIWIWDIVAAELRAVLVFHSVVTFAWHKHARELLLITAHSESRPGLSYLWDPLLPGPTPVVPDEFIAARGSSVGAPAKAQISWINLDMDIPLALLSTPQQYRILSLGEGDEVPETWHGASKWDNEPPPKSNGGGFDPDISDTSMDDGAAVEDTFQFRKT